jgi:type II secretory pathway predicted ATPase ExeA
MDYVKFYGLDREPFQNDLDGHFYFESAPQRRARLRLLRGVEQRKGLCVLLGEPGLGKTTLANQLFAQLNQAEFTARMLVSSHRECARGWFLPSVAHAYGVESPSERAPDLIDQIHARLLDVRLSGQHPVLFVDEAQLLSETVAMEEFRAILNLTHDGQRLFTLLLFGMQELGKVLQLDASLAQRVDIRAELEPMSAEESTAYVTHRLERSGGAAGVFTSDALEALHEYSGGVPRLINTLADNALFEASLAETKPIDGSVIVAVAQQLGLSGAPAKTTAGSFHIVTPPPAELGSPERLSAPVSTPPQPVPDESVFGEDTAESLGTPGVEDWLEPVAPMPADVTAALRDESDELEGRAASASGSLGISAPDWDLNFTPEASSEDEDLPAVAGDETAVADNETAVSEDALESADPHAAEAPGEPELKLDDASADLAALVEADADSSEAGLDTAAGDEEPGLAELVSGTDLALDLELEDDADDEELSLDDLFDEDESAGEALSLAPAPAPSETADAADDESEDDFDLSSLLEEDSLSEDEPETTLTPVKGPKIGLPDDEDLESLFDDIQVGED